MFVYLGYNDNDRNFFGLNNFESFNGLRFYTIFGRNNQKGNIGRFRTALSPRSGRLPLLLINLSPRLAHTGMALSDARGALLHEAELDGSGAAMRVCAMARHIRCGSGSGPLRAM